MTAYGDVPAGLALGGAVALWLALRKTGGPKWAVLPVLALAANIKANTFVLSLVAAGLMAVDAWLFADTPQKGPCPPHGFAIACFAAPMLIYYFWNIRAMWAWLPKVPAWAAPGETSAPLSAVVINGIKILLGQPVEGFYAERQSQFTQAMADMGHPVLDFGWSAEHDRPGPQCCGADSAGVLGGGHLRQRPPSWRIGCIGVLPLHAFWGITSCWRLAMALFSSRIRPWGWWIITAISIPTISAGSLWRWPARAPPANRGWRTESPGPPLDCPGGPGRVLLMAAAMWCGERHDPAAAFGAGLLGWRIRRPQDRPRRT